jgi:hypothetical protein
MSQDVDHIDSLVTVSNLRNQPVFIPADIEDGTVTDRIRVGVNFLYFVQVFPPRLSAGVVPAF